MKYYFIQTKTKKGDAILSWKDKKGIKRWKISNWITARRMLAGLRKQNPHFQYRLVSKKIGRYNKLKN